MDYDGLNLSKILDNLFVWLFILQETWKFSSRLYLPNFFSVSWVCVCVLHVFIQWKPRKKMKQFSPLLIFQMQFYTSQDDVCSVFCNNFNKSKKIYIFFSCLKWSCYILANIVILFLVKIIRNVRVTIADFRNTILTTFFKITFFSPFLFIIKFHKHLPRKHLILTKHCNFRYLKNRLNRSSPGLMKASSPWRILHKLMFWSHVSHAHLYLHLWYLFVQSDKYQKFTQVLLAPFTALWKQFRVKLGNNLTQTGIINQTVLIECFKVSWKYVPFFSFF